MMAPSFSGVEPSDQENLHYLSDISRGVLLLLEHGRRREGDVVVEVEVERVQGEDKENQEGFHVRMPVYK